MLASVFEHGAFKVATLTDPSPGPGQVLVRPLVCGICGSDVHARHHSHELAKAMEVAGFKGFMDPDLPVVMGHEFVCEIVDFGPDCERRIGLGRRVTALPFIMGGNGMELLGFSNVHNGAMAEAMLLQETMMIEVSDDVPTEIAALTEPLAVAVHAVNAARIDGPTAFAVHGCGPVGLFIIARLRHLGLGPILAIDPDPRRRAEASALGAEVAIAPGAEAVVHWWQTMGAAIGLSDTARARAARPVVFECVGKRGMLQSVCEQSPMGSMVIVVGVCMEPDRITPAYLLMKEMSLKFVFAYSQDEFREALRMITIAPDALSPLVTGHVSLNQVPEIFDAMASGNHIKMLVDAQDLTR